MRVRFGRAMMHFFTASMLSRLCQVGFMQFGNACEQLSFPTHLLCIVVLCLICLKIYCCIVVLLYCCIDVLLYCCIVVLLYCCIVELRRADMPLDMAQMLMELLQKEAQMKGT